MSGAFEIAPDKYILVTDEELESVSPERSRTIEIIEFIDLDVEPRCISITRTTSYRPKGGEKAYRLLAEVMRRTNKAGLAKFVLREREYLVAVQSLGEALTLITLHYQEEVLPEEDVTAGAGGVEAKDRGRLQKSIEKMMGDSTPGATPTPAGNRSWTS